MLQEGKVDQAIVELQMARWLEHHEYESLRQMHGSMSLLRCSNPRAYERANYIKILQSWQEPAR